MTDFRFQYMQGHKKKTKIKNLNMRGKLKFQSRYYLKKLPKKDLLEKGEVIQTNTHFWQSPKIDSHGHGIHAFWLQGYVEDHSDIR
jgi:hypothetical protein